MAAGTIKRPKRGQFVVDVTANTINTISSANDLVSGTLPDDKLHSFYNTAGYTTDNYYAEVHPASNNSIFIITDHTQKLVVTWTELN